MRRAALILMALGAAVLVGSILLTVVEIYAPLELFGVSGIVMLVGFAVSALLSTYEAHNEVEREPAPPPLRTTPGREGRHKHRPR